ncbi:DUF4265 domain-containing protein [Aliikangiella sp. IMCC44359]|uniref:DUF4265 domain-containing protein n=1 Tax=Aliikangiella sp. IMCC44359 TaxID=3459125 RepID=UPI00403B22DE
MSNERKTQITIELTPEQSEGLPVSTESLWFLKEGDFYRLINIPFFIDNLSIEDLVSISKKNSGNYEIEKIIEKSGNSTIWVTLNDEEKGLNILNQLHSLGCGFEGGVLNNYYTINIPEKISINDVDNIIGNAEKVEILAAYDSSIRH